MTAEVVEMQAQSATAGGPSIIFRGYLLSGDHWRVGKWLRDGPTAYDGMRLAQAGRPTNLAPQYVEYLDQKLVEERMADTMQVARVRHRWVEDALREVEQDRPDEAKALRYFLTPFERRARKSVLAQAIALEVTERTLYNLRDAAVRLTWDEIGGRW
jgi:hypothetical protein